jgi:phosphoglycolate phosphatase
VASPDRPRIGAILWDLDGTLVETRRDIATGVNLVLADRGLPPMSVEAVSQNVGQGSRVLMTRCLEQGGSPLKDDEDLDRAYHSFIRHYVDHLLDSSEPYDGIPELLGQLSNAGIAMAVVSNKPTDPTRRLVDSLELNRFFSLVLGGDSLPERKPHPAPLLYAMEQLGTGIDTTIMVGDSRIDLEAARAAGIPGIAVSWGFESNEVLRSANPSLFVETPDALARWILNQPL